MLNIPVLKFDKSIKYLEDQLNTQKNNKQLILGIISNIGLLLKTTPSDNLKPILNTANEFLQNISNNITIIEQLTLEIAHITNDLNEITVASQKNTKTKEYFVAAFANIKNNVTNFTEKFKATEKKLELDNFNFNKFINDNDFKYNFDSKENTSTYEFSGFSVKNNENIEKVKEESKQEETKSTEDILKSIDELPDIQTEEEPVENVIAIKKKNETYEDNLCNLVNDISNEYSSTTFDYQKFQSVVLEDDNSSNDNNDDSDDELPTYKKNILDIVKEEIINEVEPEPEPEASKSSSKAKKSARTKKAEKVEVQEIPTEAEDFESEVQLELEKAISEIDTTEVSNQSVIVTTSEDDDENNSSSEELEVTEDSKEKATEAPKETKKSRGRPRKSKIVEEVAQEIVEEVTQEPAIKEEILPANDSKVVKVEIVDSKSQPAKDVNTDKIKETIVEEINNVKEALVAEVKNMISKEMKELSLNIRSGQVSSDDIIIEDTRPVEITKHIVKEKIASDVINALLSEIGEIKQNPVLENTNLEDSSISSKNNLNTELNSLLDYELNRLNTEEEKLQVKPTTPQVNISDMIDNNSSSNKNATTSTNTNNKKSAKEKKVSKEAVAEKVEPTQENVDNSNVEKAESVQENTTSTTENVVSENVVSEEQTANVSEDASSEITIDDIDLSNDILDNILKEELTDEDLSNLDTSVEDTLFEKTVQEEISQNKPLTPETLEEIVKRIERAESINTYLIISERFNSIYLPYEIEELNNYIESYPKAYSSLADVVKQEFILDLDTFVKNPRKTRFDETYNLIRNRAGQSIIKSFSIAKKLSKRDDLNPAIIAACKSEYELKRYLNALETNSLDTFHFFKIIFDVNPL